MSAKEAASSGTKADKKPKKDKGEGHAEKPIMEQSGPAKFDIGDSVKVYVRIHEGDKERIQTFSGTVIARKGHGDLEMFTVRRISHGVGVERIFPVLSPHIAKVEVEGSTKVRRAKLYFLRKISGKSARLEERVVETPNVPAPTAVPVAEKTEKVTK